MINELPGARKRLFQLRTNFPLVLVILIFQITCFPKNAIAQEDSAEQHGGCATQYLWEQVKDQVKIYDKNADCPTYGPCDDPAVRDTHIPDENTPIKYISLYFQNVCNDDGSNPAGDYSDVLTMVTDLNADFEPWRIQFVYDWRYVYSTEYREVEVFSTDYDLKFNFAVDPLNNLNTFVTTSWGFWNDDYYVWSYTARDPWNGGETYAGGIVMNPSKTSDAGLFSHEVGHCLGLYHPFAYDGTASGGGEPCGPCYDSPGGIDQDIKGDKCSDTPPTTCSYYCGDPGGIDNCSGQPWGATGWSNYMGYAEPWSCKDHFTPQQAGRVHCWAEDALAGWISYAKIEAYSNFGPAPLDVQFEGFTSMTPYSWDWDFGDEVSGSGQTPIHTYTEPGVYNTSVLLDAVEGTFDATIARDIWVYADTVKVRNAMASAWQPVRVDICARISVPVDYIVLPLNWSGPGYLMLDSISTTGLRTESCFPPTWLELDQMNGGALKLQTVVDGLAMVPDTGAIVSLWFTPVVPGSYAENEIRIEPYSSSYVFEFSTIRGLYTPEAVNGQVIVCEPGVNCGDCFDTDQDGYGNPGYGNVCPDDNCPYAYNPDQLDSDGDGIGDACYYCIDTDGDGYGDPGYGNVCPDDNCPDLYNPDQTDSDGDGIGDACFYVATVTDTVETGCVKLAVANNGAFGEFDGATMDYYDQGDCYPEYLDLGSTIITYKKPGDAYLANHSISGLRPIAGMRDMISTQTLPDYGIFETGTMITEDSTFGLEITWWSPSGEDNCHFIIQRKKIFKYSDNPYDSLFVGDVANWELPDSVGQNLGGSDSVYNLLYISGHGVGCQDNERRYGGLTFLCSYLNDTSTLITVPYGAQIEPISGIVESGFDPFYIFNLISQPNYSVWPTRDNLLSTMTYADNLSMTNIDTFYTYSALISLRDGTVNDLRENVIRARNWASNYLGLPYFYVKGDANGDGDVNIGDAVFIINTVFKGGPSPSPLDAGDANCDYAVNIGDAVYLINHVFKGGPRPC
ncbi:MAG: PKD domain-containing protein [candidate division Zixibacteria bacterium]